MRRRSLLATVGATLSTTVSGCTGSGPFTGGSDDGESASIDPPSEPPEYADWYDRDFERVVDYDESDLEEVPAYLEPSTRSISLEDSITFTLVNQRDELLYTNPIEWLVLKRVDDEWTLIQGSGGVFISTPVDPDGTYAWTVQTSANDEVIDGEMARVGWGGERDERLAGEEYTNTMTGFTGGLYAISRRCRFGEESSAPPVVTNAYVRIEADSFELTPTNEIETRWDGETLLADADRGSGREGTFVLEEVSAEDASDPAAFTTEQLVHRWSKLSPVRRDAIALHTEHDPDRVRLTQRNDQRPIFGIDEATYYEHDGSYYRATAETA